MLNSPLFLLGFLSVFHIIGGSVIGTTLHKMRRGNNVPGQTVLFLWGIMFGGLPLLFGVGMSQEPGAAWLLPAQFTILFGTILVTFLWGDSLKDTLNQKSIKLMSGGGAFMIIGSLAVSALFSEGEWWLTLLFGGVFIGVGLLLFIGGLRIVLRQFIDLEEAGRDSPD